MRWPNPNSRKPDESLHPRTSAKRLEARLSIDAPHPISLRSTTHNLPVRSPGKRTCGSKSLPSGSFICETYNSHIKPLTYIGSTNNACQVFFCYARKHIVSGGPCSRIFASLLLDQQGNEFAVLFGSHLAYREAHAANIPSRSAQGFAVVVLSRFRADRRKGADSPSSSRPCEGLAAHQFIKAAELFQNEFPQKEDVSWCTTRFFYVTTEIR